MRRRSSQPRAVRGGEERHGGPLPATVQPPSHKPVAASERALLQWSDFLGCRRSCSSRSRGQGRKRCACARPWCGKSRCESRKGQQLLHFLLTWTGRRKRKWEGGVRTARKRHKNSPPPLEKRKEGVERRLAESDDAFRLSPTRTSRPGCRPPGAGSSPRQKWSSRSRPGRRP